MVKIVHPERARELKEEIRICAMELAHYCMGHRVKIEINIDKSKKECKINIVDCE